MKESPLQSRRILVTRAKDQAKSFTEKIESNGGTAIEVPLITFQKPVKQEEIEQALSSLHTYDWLIFTSINGVHFFFDFLEEFNVAFEYLNDIKIAVVGTKTKEALAQYGVFPSLIPDEFVAESLSEELVKTLQAGEKVLFPKGNLARDLIPRKLSKMDLELTELVIYENVIETRSKEKLQELLMNKDVDIITFTSSSTVKNFVMLLRDESWENYINQLTFACIGPIAAKTAEQYGLTPHIVASTYTIDGLIQAIIDYLEEEEQ
ncbi:uroporphyrinogen-III synthase [Bacillus sp. FJAT-45350]|uniref:uroporphyrinogen-III synthase n=1 Tax=Bacillus sp. FJAT-45350 TaxID=2011014 RepID=UPI000BB73817|nr:uroporphyrinogen-III synthase [Bacillus sp. FJAT-45350]